MATKTHSAGTVLGYSNTQNGSYTNISDIITITPPTYPRSKVDVTVLGSANRTREFIKGWKTPGDAKFGVYMAKTQFASMLTLQDDNTTYWWQISFPLIDSEANNSKFQFQAQVIEVSLLEVSAENDDVWRADVGLAATTQPSFTAGT